MKACHEVPEHRARHGAMIISKVFWGKTKASAAELENCAGWKLLGEQSIPLQLHGVKKIQLELMEELFPSRIIAADSTTKVINVIQEKEYLRAEQYIDQRGKIQNGLHQTNRNF